MKSFSTVTSELNELKRSGHLEVATTSAEDAYKFFAGQLEMLKLDIDKTFPNFMRNYTLVKGKVSFGRFKRKEMPVVQSVNLDRFKRWMASEHSVKVVKTKVKPVNLYPLQKQLYIDKPIDNIRTHGLKNSIDFIKNKSHSLVSHDNRIMDGNHRWLLAALYDPDMQVSGYVIGMDHDELVKAMIYFTDKILKRSRNESVVV